jgi:putative transposase
MYTVYKLELALSKPEIDIIDSQAMIAHNLYNDLLELAKAEIEFKQQNKQFNSFNPFNAFQLRNQVPILKKAHPVYKTIYSSVAKNVSFRLSAGINLYTDYLKHKSKYSHEVGFPKFRSWKKYGFMSLKYEEPLTGYRIEDNKLCLVLGRNADKKRLKLELPFKDTFKIDKNSIKVLEIVKTRNKYYACFTCSVPDKPKKPIKRIIALDPNHKNLAVGYTSDKESITINNLWFVKEIAKRINSIKSKKSKCTKLSRRWTRLNNKLQELYRVQRDRIQVGLRSICNTLCKHYDLIAIGDYVPKAAGNKKLNNAIINLSHIGEFRSILERTCERSGKTFQVYDEHNTTRTCSTCGVVGSKKDPSIREWECESCGDHHNRDENSAKLGYRLTMLKNELSCSDYLDIVSRYACDFTGSKVKLQGIKSADEHSTSFVDQK